MYDFGDTAMMEALRPSIEEAFPIQTQEVRRRPPAMGCSNLSQPLPVLPRPLEGTYLCPTVRTSLLWRLACMPSLAEPTSPRGLLGRDAPVRPQL